MSKQFRVFALEAKNDPMRLAIGIEFPNGTCSLSWIEFSGTNVYQSIKQVESDHCQHSLKIVWLADMSITSEPIVIEQERE